MNANRLFFIGIAIDAFALLLSLSNIFLMDSPLKSPDGTVYDTSNGLSDWGRRAIWLMPIGLLGLIACGFWLRSLGKILFAAILVWIPALPMLIGLVITVGLAILFMLFGK